MPYKDKEKQKEYQRAWRLARKQDPDWVEKQRRNAQTWKKLNSYSNGVYRNNGTKTAPDGV